MNKRIKNNNFNSSSQAQRLTNVSRSQPREKKRKPNENGRQSCLSSCEYRTYTTGLKGRSDKALHLSWERGKFYAQRGSRGDLAFAFGYVSVLVARSRKSLKLLQIKLSDGLDNINKRVLTKSYCLKLRDVFQAFAHKERGNFQRFSWKFLIAQSKAELEVKIYLFFTFSIYVIHFLW